MRDARRVIIEVHHNVRLARGLRRHVEVRTTVVVGLVQVDHNAGGVLALFVKKVVMLVLLGQVLLRLCLIRCPLSYFLLHLLLHLFRFLIIFLVGGSSWLGFLFLLAAQLREFVLQHLNKF